MKYIVKIKGARIFHADKQGVLRATSGVINRGTVVKGSFVEKKVATPKGIRVVSFLRIPTLRKVDMFIRSLAVAPYKVAAFKAESSANFSGSEIVDKMKGADVIIPVSVFGGLGFIIGSIIGQSRLSLTLGGAIVGGLIGMSGSGEKMMGADGRGRGRTSGRYGCVRCSYPCGTLLSGETKYCKGCEDAYGRCSGGAGASSYADGREVRGTKKIIRNRNPETKRQKCEVVSYTDNQGDTHYSYYYNNFPTTKSDCAAHGAL